MSHSVFRNTLFSFLVAFAGMSSVLAQTVTVNGASCNGATVTLGAGTIAISTANCGSTATAPTITSGPPTAGNVGAPYSFLFTASGTAPITWALSGTPVPGLSLSSGGLLSGTPSTNIGSPFAIVVTASNGTAPAAVGNYNLTVSNTPVITSATPPTTATPGTTYSHQFVASQTIPTGGWSVTSGTLPASGWLTLNPSNGVLSGIPAAGDAGTSTFSVSATNPNGTTVPQSVTINVVAPAPPVFTSTTPPGGTVGTAYSFNFTASGSPAPTFALVAGGTLPPPLTLSSAGVLSGTPTTAGTYNFAVQASNTGGTALSPATLTHSVVIAPLTGGAGTRDINNTLIPVPSKLAGVPPTAHAPPNGAGSLYAWAVNPTRCDNTQPAITSSWHHNIDFQNHRLQGQIDFFDMAPNESLTYEFTPPDQGFAYSGNFFIGSNNVQYQLPANFATISTKPCDFDLTKLIPGAGRDYCFVTAPVDNQLSYTVTNGAAYFTCKMTPGTKYYFNLRWQNGNPGGPNTSDSCTTLGYGRCGAYVQIR